MRIALIVAVFCVTPFSNANAQQTSDLPSTGELGNTIRTVLVPNLPSPLVQQEMNWGHQEKVVVGIRWEKDGLLLKPHTMKKLHNDGIWRRIQVEADHAEKTFKVSITDIKVPEPGKLTFSASISLQTNIKFEQQVWHAGTRLYSGETRARARVLLKLQCESTSRFEKQPNSFIPDYVFRLRITQAALNYDNFVCEHTAGVGGDAAKILGDAVHEAIKQLKPSLERKLLEKANARIVKVADTKEVRLGLRRLMQTDDKKPSP